MRRRRPRLFRAEIHGPSFGTGHRHVGTYIVFGRRCRGETLRCIGFYCLCADERRSFVLARGFWVLLPWMCFAGWLGSVTGRYGLRDWLIGNLEKNRGLEKIVTRNAPDWLCVKFSRMFKAKSWVGYQDFPFYQYSTRRTTLRLISSYKEEWRVEINTKD